MTWSLQATYQMQEVLGGEDVEVSLTGTTRSRWDNNRTWTKPATIRRGICNSKAGLMAFREKKTGDDLSKLMKTKYFNAIDHFGNHMPCRKHPQRYKPTQRRECDASNHPLVSDGTERCRDIVVTYGYKHVDMEAR